jgi:hypothetical protein
MLPSKKRQIVEVQANAAAIIKQQVEIKREIESAGSVIIRHEPELRLDNLGDIVSTEAGYPDRTASIERRAVEARRSIKKAELADPSRTAAIERGRQIVEARRKALVVAEKTTTITKSPSPEKYLRLDKSAQDNFHERASEYKGDNRRVSPTPDLFQHYNAARDTHLSDGQLGVMALEAWRSHLRKKHEYLPDRNIASSVHLDHLKVFSSALTDFKRQRTALNLWGESAVAYKHERYSVVCQKYRIPAEICTPKELMRSVERKDMNILYRKRCCQLNKFYSMLLKDTPGYIPAPDYKERGPQSRATEPKPEPPIRKNPAINPMAGRADTNQWMGPPPSTTKLDVLIPKERVDANTEDLSARRAKNMHRDMKKDRRFNPIAGEEVGYSSESGNKRDDYENSQYDNRMVPADKKIRAKLEWKIKRIKTNVLPKEFTTQRQDALQKAQAEFEKTGVFPAYLSGVKSPWNIGVGLAYTRYNEWILTELERQLSILRERNAQNCALEDASKNTDGPVGRGHR